MFLRTLNYPVEPTDYISTMKRLFQTTLFIVVVLSVFTSCVREKTIVRKTMENFLESNVVLTDDLYVVDDRVYANADLSNLCNLKLIVYVDSLSCSSCRIAHFIDLLPLYEMAESDGRFSIVAIFSPRVSEIPDVERQLMLLDFPYPIYVDVSGEFARQNQIPKDSRFHYFLSDDNGQILFVGNPIANEQLKSVFSSTLHNIKN